MKAARQKDRRPRRALMARGAIRTYKVSQAVQRKATKSVTVKRKLDKTPINDSSQKHCLLGIIIIINFMNLWYGFTKHVIRMCDSMTRPPSYFMDCGEARVYI